MRQENHCCQPSAGHHSVRWTQTERPALSFHLNTNSTAPKLHMQSRWTYHRPLSVALPTAHQHTRPN